MPSPSDENARDASLNPVCTSENVVLVVGNRFS